MGITDAAMLLLNSVAHPVVVACSDSLQARMVREAHPSAEYEGAAGAQAP